ncbi:MAG: hypothetical protein LBQ43_03940 [Holosporales bacterium]|jgi:hypothetical protein|nr:hypothetical protein [Holosporales bacterium]
MKNVLLPLYGLLACCSVYAANDPYAGKFPFGDTAVVSKANVIEDIKNIIANIERDLTDTEFFFSSPVSYFDAMRVYARKLLGYYELTDDKTHCHANMADNYGYVIIACRDANRFEYNDFKKTWKEKEREDYITSLEDSRLTLGQGLIEHAKYLLNKLSNEY